MKSGIFILLCAIHFFTHPTPAEASQPDPDFTLNGPYIREIKEVKNARLSAHDLYSIPRFIDPDFMDEPTEISPPSESNEPTPTASSPSENPFPELEQMIYLGKSIWQLVQAGAPVTHYQTDSASVLPPGTKTWQELTHWQNPISKTYEVTYKNGFGNEVIHFTYRILFTYGGQLNNQGRYLSHITVVPATLSVKWGYRFSAQAQIVNITNAGTVTDPIPAAELLVSWTIDTMIRHSEFSTSFYVKGDGEFLNLSSDAEPSLRSTHRISEPY